MYKYLDISVQMCIHAWVLHVGPEGWGVVSLV